MENKFYILFENLIIIQGGFLIKIIFLIWLQMESILMKVLLLVILKNMDTKLKI